MTESPPQAFPSVFVKQVFELLAPAQRQLLNRLTFAGASGNESKFGAFLNQLFSRATPEMIKHRTVAEVAALAGSCFRALESLASAPDRISLSIEQDGAVARLFLALDDHPFIISSIAERLSDAGARVVAFFHPVVRCDGKPIALSYVELGDAAELDASRLLPRLQETLQLLKQVVLDFEAMTTSAVRAASLLDAESVATPFGETTSIDAHAFLSWLADGSFFFIGTAQWHDSANLIPAESFGAWRVAGRFSEQLRSETLEDLKALRANKLGLSIRKLRLSSAVHRPATLLNIVIALPRARGPALSFVGYLTSKAWTHEAQDIPILRHKVAAFLAQEGATPNSHDYKYMLEVVDNMPTDEALASPSDRLRLITRLALGVFSHEATRTLSCIDELKRRALTVVVLPPERFSAATQEELQRIIESAFQAPQGSSEIHLDSSKRRQYRLYFSTPLPPNHSGDVPEQELSSQIPHATLTWEERLQQLLDEPGAPVWDPSVFPADYQAGTSVDEALFDIQQMSGLAASSRIACALYLGHTTNARPVVSIFSRGSEVSISSAIAVLENIGIEVVRAHSHSCAPASGRIHILKLIARAYDGVPLSPEHFNTAVSPGLTEILAGKAANDVLNVLLRRIPITIAQINLLRCYCALLWQVQKISTKRTMWKALAQAPNVSLQLVKMFEWKFDPSLKLSIEERAQRAAEEGTILIDALRFVADITHDRVLRALVSLVKNTVRTSFYSGTSTTALKLTPREIEVMPHPRPLFEIFVFSPSIEGTHLRSARVARGGIRWSERPEDFRAEVLGLMKTQRVKNVIIVPSGAKGGFVLKAPPKDPDALPKAVEAGYREYITALLTLADNKDGAAIKHPPGLIVYDEPDPYFVVAADKGTATFSDIANSIAKEQFNFWLGDAFASGGSAGYDHKKHGITAKGGWECVQRHFKDLSIDYVAAPFSVVGIGDMSGDVFGNALMLSRNMKLIAAFNHKHIFIDPSPDLDKSFAERVRLFGVPRSQWSDYNASLISAGGGVFNRFDKELTLSPEARTVLGIPEDAPAAMTGEAIVSHILKAPVDLLWNGGIGTYVKANGETHAEVNDGTNDGVRIDADELRARVVGEGGNLGFTQEARIEYSLRGGRINTDAIDNSGGVDLSDHEVNLKLLFAPLLASGSLSLESRNALLKEIAGDVVNSVLQQNRDQSLLLSVSASRSSRALEQYRYLLRDMNRLGFLDRVRDSLPDEQELDDRAESQAGLTRPELAVCSAATKMWVKEELRASRLCSDKALEPFLLGYFPAKVQERFHAPILEHPLRNDIIASCVINELLPAIGIPFVHNLSSSSGIPVPATMKCILAADLILGSKPLRERLRNLDTPSSCAGFTELWLELGAALRDASGWLLHTHGSQMSLLEMADLYAPTFQTLSENAELVFAGQELVRFERRREHYKSLGVSPQDAVRLSLLRRVLPVLEVLWSSREFAKEVTVVASVYSRLLEELGVNTLFKYEQILESTNKWETELVAGSYQEIRRNLSLLTGKVLGKGALSGDEVAAVLKASPGLESIRTTMADVEEAARHKRPFQVAVLPVISRQLRLLST